MKRPPQFQFILSSILIERMNRKKFCLFKCPSLMFDLKASPIQKINFFSFFANDVLTQLVSNFRKPLIKEFDVTCLVNLSFFSLRLD
jgi:hypothetical protein